MTSDSAETDLDRHRWSAHRPDTFVDPQRRPLPAALAAFTGDRGSFFGLVSRGALLEFVTLGFYRFWLATDIRRHLWSRTAVGGDAAEYIGTGRELLIGFLFALAILAPIYLLYFLVGIELERAKAFASIPLFVFFYAFGQFAIFRARRYRLTRTVWRGVRFWMTGSGMGYAARAMLWSVAMALTLGLVLPWREAALERYKMRHSYYGDLQGRFEGRGWDFFRQGWWLYPLAILSLAVTPLAPFVFGMFKATEWRWWLSGLRFGDVRVESSLGRGELISLYWKVIGWMILLAIVLVAYLALGTVAVSNLSGIPTKKLFAAGMSSGSVAFMVMFAVGYLVFLLAANVVMRVYLLRDLWQRVIETVQVHNLAAADNVTGLGTAATALGEGLADGLDVAGF